MSGNDNKRLVRRYFEDAPRNPAACGEIFAPRFLFHTLQHASLTPPVTEASPDSEKAAYAWLAAVWSPEWRITIDETIAEGDRVMVRWTLGRAPRLTRSIRGGILAHNRIAPPALLSREAEGPAR